MPRSSVHVIELGIDPVGETVECIEAAHGLETCFVGELRIGEQPISQRKRIATLRSRLKRVLL
jgi:hypothetical protein